MAKANAAELDGFLLDLAQGAAAGERLPAIRELMRRFRVSQVVVERALQELKSRGLIDSQVGRGTFFKGTGASAGSPMSKGATAVSVDGRAAERRAGRSVLLLRRSISITRGRLLVEGLQRRFAADNCRVLEVSYTDPDHARLVLKGLPHLDACIVQSTFRPITVELLADLRSKCDVLAVDGAALSGTDVESVGMEWGEPLEEAIEALRRHGHRRIAYASTAFPFLAGQMGERRFDHLQRRLTDLELHRITVPELPHENYEETLAQILVEQRQRHGFTGLVAWGIEDGRRFGELLSQAGVDIPSTLSVVLLGRTDIASEHAEFFHTVGCQIADQVEQMYEAVKARWAHPDAPFAVRLIPVTVREGDSVSAPSRPRASAGEMAKKPKRGAAAAA